MSRQEIPVEPTFTPQIVLAWETIYLEKEIFKCQTLHSSSAAQLRSGGAG